jgi:mannose-6-phosphate isomerase-like protein (cupin superfamily)
MIIKSITNIKKRVTGGHGETSLYQGFWEGEAKPESMKAFTNFARITVKPGGTNRVHTHKDIEQVYIILRGGGTMQVSDEKAEVKAGDAIFLPRAIGHGFFNTTDKIAVILMLGCGGEYSYPRQR